MAKTRESNVELLRIVLMTMILLSHLLTHGKFELPEFKGTYSIQDSALLSFTRYHVNTFIIISGFFGISLKFQKIFSFVIMILFWTIIGAIIDYSFFKESAIYHIITSLINPFTSGWFIIQYFALMLYAPLLNKGIKALSNHQFIAIMIIFLAYIYGLFPIIVSASSPPTFEFMAMYLIGRFINRYQSRLCTFSWPKIIITNSMLGICLFVMVVLSRSNQLIHSRLLSNQDPIVIMMGVALFLLFKKIRVKEAPLINAVASGVIAAYLLTDCTLTGRWLDKWFYNNSNDNAIIMIMICLTLVALLGTLEYTRKFFFKKRELQLYSYLKAKIIRQNHHLL